jgi:aminoglycoside 6'-N-acetyltransferase
MGLRKSVILTLAPFLFMNKVYLRKIKYNDKKYFAKWWRDKELLKLTSGILKRISDQKVDKYFQAILYSKNDYDFMITINKKVIGHICLAKRKYNWYETQIVIGEKNYWGKGCGPTAIKLIKKKATRLGIPKIYLEVRPTNIRAIRAYENCGFQKVRAVLYPKNKYLPRTLRMELKK